jgi:hypothetical protein
MKKTILILSVIALFFACTEDNTGTENNGIDFDQSCCENIANSSDYFTENLPEVLKERETVNFMEFIEKEFLQDTVYDYCNTNTIQLTIESLSNDNSVVLSESEMSEYPIEIAYWGDNVELTVSWDYTCEKLDIEQSQNCDYEISKILKIEKVTFDDDCCDSIIENGTEYFEYNLPSQIDNGSNINFLAHIEKAMIESEEYFYCSTAEVRVNIVSLVTDYSVQLTEEEMVDYTFDYAETGNLINIVIVWQFLCEIEELDKSNECYYNTQLNIEIIQ